MNMVVPPPTPTGWFHRGARNHPRKARSGPPPVLEKNQTPTVAYAGARVRLYERKRGTMPIRVTVTYDSVTEESVTDGDMSDCGFVCPKTGARRSLMRGGKRMYDRNVRMSQKGKFDWSLREAIKYVDEKQCGTLEGEYQHDGSLTVRAPSDGYDIECGRNGYEYGESTTPSLHVSGISDGSKIRLTRVLQNQGVRFY